MRKSFEIETENYLPQLRELYVDRVNAIEPYRSARFGQPEFQSVRLEVIWDIVSDCKSVLDVGCGRAEFIEYIDNDVAYHGIDLVEEFITWLKERRGHWPYPWTFECHDLRDEPRPAEAVIGSSVFALCNDEIFWSMLDAMWESATKILVFNCKSTCAESMDGWEDQDYDVQYFRDPFETLKECSKRYTSKILYRHDYFNGDFTLGIYK